MKISQEKSDGWPLVGNEPVIEFLSRSLKADKIAGSYLFLGPDDLGKTTIALNFAKSLLCSQRDQAAKFCGQCSSCRQFGENNNQDETSQRNLEIIHPDIRVLKREAGKKNISIEQIREFISALGKTSFLNSYKIGIIKEAERLSTEAANALLKILEEPRAKVVIILVASNQELLPTTIISRCQIVRFYPVRADVIYDYLLNQYRASRRVAKKLSHLAMGRPALAVKFFEDEELTAIYQEQANSLVRFFKQDLNARLKTLDNLTSGRAKDKDASSQTDEILEIWEGAARDILLAKHGLNNLLQNIEALEEIDQNISSPQAINMLNLIEVGRNYLKANVSPRIVLENIAINL